MKGYAIIKTGEHGWIDVDEPVAGPLDAICKPIAVAPCSSDTHAMHAGMGPAGPLVNRIMGHEAIGEVVEVGELVTRFKPGDKVVIPCTTPDWAGKPNLQEKGTNNAHDFDVMTSFKFLIQEDGVFAERFRVNNADNNMVLLPEGMDLADALMVTDMMSTGFYGAEMADVKLGDTVVVFGIGPVGLMAVAGAQLMGAGKIYATGTRKNCADLALEYGATEIISYKDGNTVEQILEKEGGRKVDAVIIAGGNCGSMNEALQLVKPNGAIGSINFYDLEDVFTVPAFEWGLGMADVTIRGGFCPGGALRAEKLLNLIKYDRIKPGKTFNYEFHGFDKIKDAFILMDEKPRDLIKPIVYIDDLD